MPEQDSVNKEGQSAVTRLSVFTGSNRLVYLNSMAFTGFTFRTMSVGINSEKKQTTSVAAQTAVTCHHIISTGASDT